jgi:hypothetical protein
MFIAPHHCTLLHTVHVMHHLWTVVQTNGGSVARLNHSFGLRDDWMTADWVETSKSTYNNLQTTTSTQAQLLWQLVSSGRIIQVTPSNLVVVSHTKHVEEQRTSPQTTYLLILSWSHACGARSDRMALKSIPAASSFYAPKLLVLLVMPSLILPPKVQTITCLS